MCRISMNSAHIHKYFAKKKTFLKLVYEVYTQLDNIK